MARTYRRRHVPDWESFVLSDYVRFETSTGGYWHQRVSVDKNSPEGKVLLARFHADRPYHPGPPKSWRQPYHHSERQACRRAIFVWLHRDDHDFLPPPPHLNSARWDWF